MIITLAGADFSSNNVNNVKQVIASYSTADQIVGWLVQQNPSGDTQGSIGTGFNLYTITTLTIPKHAIAVSIAPVNAYNGKNGNGNITTPIAFYNASGACVGIFDTLAIVESLNQVFDITDYPIPKGAVTAKFCWENTLYNRADGTPVDISQTTPVITWTVKIV